jgi:hypothetical protein
MTDKGIMDPEFQSKFDPGNPLVEKGIFRLGPRIGGTRKTHTCFARGTQITLADGGAKAIETIVPATPSNPSGGDILLSVDGVKTYVVGMLAGPRPEPCIRIKAKSVSTEFPGEIHKVTVSMSHTVSVNLSRMVHAWLLRKGDYVCTTHGEAIIDKIGTVDYDDDVWNFYLASSDFVVNVLPNLTPERLYYHLCNSSLGLTPKQHLVLGNGILSGDLYVQIQAQEFARQGYSLKLFV